MMPVRKLTFQLTPLLDLLLIVIFAQYLEVRSAAREETTRAEDMNRRLAQELDETFAQLDQLRGRLQRFDELQEEQQSLTQQVAEVQAQRDLIGELVAETFRIPEGMIDDIVQQRAAIGPGPDAEAIGQLLQQLKKLAPETGEAAVQHLLVFHELRKRCDLWEVYIQEDGQIVLTSGKHRQVVRAETTDTFASRFFDFYKELPQPKSLVLVLVSYGDARKGIRKSVLDALPSALERIREDDESRSRYDFAVLGFRPELPPP